MRSKKAQDLDLIADVTLAIIMLTGAYFVSRGILLASSTSDRVVFEEAVVDLNNDELFIQFLKSENNGIRMSDIIVYSYLNNDKDYLKQNLDEYLLSIYLRPVCYQLTIDNFEVKESCSQKEEYPLLDTKIEVPTIDGKSIFIEFIIEGYS